MTCEASAHSGQDPNTLRVAASKLTTHQAILSASGIRGTRLAGRLAVVLLRCAAEASPFGLATNTPRTLSIQVRT